MQKEWLNGHIVEAIDQLEKISKKFKEDPDYNNTKFEIDMQHAFDHLNTAYNTRNYNTDQIDKLTSDEFDNLRKMPQDLYLLE